MIPQFLGVGDSVVSGFGRLGVDGERTGECGICNKPFGRSSVGQLNGVLVHGSCYGKAMDLLRSLVILKLVDDGEDRG